MHGVCKGVLVEIYRTYWIQTGNIVLPLPLPHIMGTVVPKLGSLRNGQRIIMRMTKSFNRNFFLIVEIFIEAQNTSILSKVVPKVSDFWTPALWGRTGSWNESSFDESFKKIYIYQFSNLANSKDILSWTKVFVSLSGPVAKRKLFLQVETSAAERGKSALVEVNHCCITLLRAFYWNE